MKSWYAVPTDYGSTGHSTKQSQSDRYQNDWKADESVRLLVMSPYIYVVQT